MSNKLKFSVYIICCCMGSRFVNGKNWSITHFVRKFTALKSMRSLRRMHTHSNITSFACKLIWREWRMINFSPLQIQRRQARVARRRTIAINVASVVLIVAAFAIVGEWDSKPMADRTLTAVAAYAPVRDRVDARNFCRVPAPGQTLIMKHDSNHRIGYQCTTLEREWPMSPVRVSP